ncbi:type VI secretion system protein TssL, short form [Pseudomonas sp. Q1-7]|uniref:type VI secretion system protein TssL, short form n=1 Tax=Pseudomonas sp. Q1-7 TaxID=3020843 RepID=UPI0023009B2B|nr:type VI secretion system protein TssL, short form [Pseudomonas sp. Q1-7]
MNLKAETQNLSAIDVDALLQDSYLLVVELREGARAPSGRDLWTRCSNQVEEVREQLKNAGMSQRSIDHISYAQCALLDETVLGCTTEKAHADWAAEPLQAKFFNRHQAGEFLYEDMREVLRDPAPDLQVLTVFQRVLMLGFKGRYSDLEYPEREQILSALSARVAPFVIRHALISGPGRTDGFHVQRLLHSPLMQCLAAVVLLVGAWWGLNHLLGEAITSLLPGKV